MSTPYRRREAQPRPLFRVPRLLVLLFLAALLVPAGVAADTAPAVFAGHVVDSRGVGVPGVQVVVLLDGRPVQTVPTGAAGEFAIATLAPGRYVIEVQVAESGERLRRDLTIGDRPVRLELSVNARAIREEVVVTAPPMREPLTVVTDPRKPQQPIPASDGASYLGNIPGFAVTRKGGTDGDPSLRGLAGSRLNILLDGEQIYGGCGNRMDPPTAYVFPETFDRVVVVKGPQTVVDGNGNLAGVVRFERDTRRAEELSLRGTASGMAAGFGRTDGVASGTLAGRLGYVRTTATRSAADDYADGDGRDVHSAYSRWSANLTAGWTPSDDSRLELSVDRSDGEAAYADRTMDGTKFDREGYRLAYEHRNLGAVVVKLDAQAYHNYVDHVMDNYSLRAAPMMRMLNNPDRLTEGGKLALTLRPFGALRLTAGSDYQQNIHTRRNATGAATATYTALPRIEDMRFEMLGLFGEGQIDLGDDARLVAGLRADSYTATNVVPTTANPVREDKRTLVSGFARYERRAATLPLTGYIGLGHAERPADYWERITYLSFGLRPERSTQLDAGAIYDGKIVRGSVSAYYAQMDDFILTGVRRIPGSMPGTFTTVNFAQNVDATRFGAEVEGQVKLSGSFSSRASLVYVRGQNDTDNVALAQTPPLETRFGVDFDNGRWSAGASLRAVAEQDRFDVRTNALGQRVTYGNVVGQDIGRAPGYTTFAVNAGVRIKKSILVTAGVDNLFDKSFAEFISRGGASISGFVQTVRVNEPGRLAWVKLNLQFD